MRVRLVKPPIVQNEVRGVGVYGRNLTEELGKVPSLEITDNNPDLVHFLYFDPFFLTLPPIRKTKTVVTVFDLTPIVLPNLYPRGVRGEIKWQIQKRLLKSVDAIITISQSAKNDIVKIIGIPQEKVFVTYLAAGTECKKLNLRKKDFILYIGDVNANKNIFNLLKAIAILPNQKLVLVGKAFVEPELPEARAIRDEIKNLGIEDRVTLAGYVSDEEKIVLLNKAAVYVQPSIYEGFGLPVLEAMSCGTPVVCGRNSSLPEIAGEAAIFADVINPQDLAQKIIMAKKGELVAKGLVQAKKFSWEKTARESYKIYEKVLAGK